MSTMEICKADLANLRTASMYAKNLDAIDYVEARIDRTVAVIEEVITSYSNRSDRALETIRDTLTDDERNQYIVMSIRKAVNTIILNGPHAKYGETWVEFDWLDAEYESVLRDGLMTMTDQAMLQFLAYRSPDGDADYILS